MIDYATEVQEKVTRAATQHVRGHPETARRLTHEAYALVVAANSPHVAVGQPLSELIERYGNGAA